MVSYLKKKAKSVTFAIFDLRLGRLLVVRQKGFRFNRVYVLSSLCVGEGLFLSFCLINIIQLVCI